MTAENLHTALAAFQAELPTVTTDQTAQVETRSGGSYSYSYASLADVHRAVLPLLASHGLTWTCVPDTQAGTMAGVLTHSATGEQITALWQLPQTSDPQAIGSAMTYGRRYLLSAVVGIAPDSDDDGAHARRAAQQQRREEPDLLTQAQRLTAAWVPIQHLRALLDAYQTGASDLADLQPIHLQRLVRALSAPETRQRVLDGAARRADQASEDDEEEDDLAQLDALVADWYDTLTVLQISELVRQGQVSIQPSDDDDETVTLDLSAWTMEARAALVDQLEGPEDRRKTVSALVATVLDPDPVGDHPEAVRIPRDA